MRTSRAIALAALLWRARAAANSDGKRHQQADCRCIPGDACWPSEAEWQTLNATVGGRLIATVPLAAPCHDPTYDAAACATLRANWLWPQQHYDSSSSIMAPFFANRSCDPFTPEPSPCLLGNYVNYAINVSSAADVASGIRFAREKNIRLVVRNTGHDYLAKSTAPHSLALWTHHLTALTHTPRFSSPHYTGAAVRLGAGVQGGAAYAHASARNLSVLGGECPTVGLAGGYAQGGGHSALSSRHGLAADQVLAWEVVDGAGVARNVSRGHPLFWALAGGGGGAFAAVVAMTVKAHADARVAGANLTFARGHGAGAGDAFYAAVAAWQAALPSVVDAGAMAVWYFTNASFSLSPVTAPGLSAEELRRLLAPFVARLDALGIEHRGFVADFPGYYEQFRAMQSPIQVGIAQYGGWLIPRRVVLERNDELTAAYRRITEDGATFIGVGLNVSKEVAGDVDNAVLPAWRETLIDTVITTPWNFTAPWEDMIRWQDKMTNEYIPQLTALAPESGAYLNEADFRQPNWQKAFYGSNYEKLRAIKKKYDPDDVFYALTAVGSDEWEVRDDGRLCRVAQSKTKTFSRSDFQESLPDL